jgi:hypothetical protein
MATVTYTFIPNDIVWHVRADNEGVAEATVRTVTITHKNTGTTIEYDIAYIDALQGSAVAEEADLFADIDAALAEYKIRLT